MSDIFEILSVLIVEDDCLMCMSFIDLMEVVGWWVEVVLCVEKVVEWMVEF